MFRKILSIMYISLLILSVIACLVLYFTKEEWMLFYDGTDEPEAVLLVDTTDSDGKAMKLTLSDRNVYIRPGRKTVRVRNTGSSDIWVKVRITCYSPETGKTSRADFFAFAGRAAAWKPAADSCCYYTRVLSPGEKTAPLFKEVRTKSDSEEERWVCLRVYKSTAGECEEVWTAKGWL